MTTLDFEVIGQPSPQGNHRTSRYGAIYETSKNHKPWRDSVVVAAKAAAIRCNWRVAPARSIGCVMTFRFQRPEKHYRGGRFAHLLKPNAPRFKATAPDLDKLARAIGDALKAADVIADDARIAHIEATKVYVGKGDWTGALISIYPLDES